MKARYAVRIEMRSFLAPLIGAKPHVEFHYHRWRWLAKLCAFLDNGVSIAGSMSRATYLGRVRLKTPGQMAWEQSCRLQREIYAANCAENQNWLSSANARDTLVQGRDRRNVASRVLSPLAHLQAQEQSGERE